jgi:hypothetical protein
LKNCGAKRSRTCSKDHRQSTQQIRTEKIRGTVAEVQQRFFSVFMLKKSAPFLNMRRFRLPEMIKLPQKFTSLPCSNGKIAVYYYR